jgi:hypothetical protein
MKPKSKATEQAISLSKSLTYQFGQVSPTEWRVAGKTTTIDEFIEDQAQQVNSTDPLLGYFERADPTWCHDRRWCCAR